MTWLVIGAGVSGLGAAKYLRARGESVRMSERSLLSPEKAEVFRKLGVELKDGGHDLSHLDGVTQVVLSPGLPWTHPLVVAAHERQLPLLSEIDLALRDYKGTVVAVTGTNGKSTTCAMLGHVMQKAGLSVTVGGNFGDPPTATMAEGRAGDYLVLELSSYQLEQSELVRAKAAVFTSFSYDHLARHGSLAGYLRAKWRLFDRLPAGALAVMPSYIFEAAKAEGLTLPAGVTLVLMDRELVETLPLAAAGVTERQNQLNAGFTLACVAHLTGRSMTALAPLLAGFRGLPHRCELIGRLPGGKPVINDSKSTNVESTLVALQSQTEPVILMMGGQGKGEPYAPLLQESAKIKALVTFGASGPDIARDVRGQLTVQEFPTLRAALSAIGGILREHANQFGVLFSPGCASFDEFKNYEERGDVFRSAMKGHLEGAQPCPSPTGSPTAKP